MADEDFEENKQLVWNVFYHFLLDNKSLSLLTNQCAKLVAASSDLAAWRKSSFSLFIDIGNPFTLRELRRYWSLYASTEGSSRSSKFRANFLSEMKGNDEVYFRAMLSLSRSIRPLGPEVLEPCMEAVYHFRNSGVTHTRSEDIKIATNINPTFAYSSQGEGFMAHHRTTLLSAFHLAQAFIPNDVTPAPPYSSSLDHLFGTIHSQFFSWCGAFRRRLTPTHHECLVTVRVIVADALAFCNALSTTRPGHHSPRVSPWRGAILDLDWMTGNAPRSFDIIETSNLSDNYGMLNIVVASSALLKRCPTSVLYTETLSSPIISGTPSKTSLGQRLCGDVAILSILLDLAPISAIAGYTTSPVLYDSPAMDRHQRIAWKKPSQLSGLSTSYSPVAFGTSELAEVLFNIYLQIFSRENHSDLKRQKWTLRTLLFKCSIHYSRSSFAHFLFGVSRSVAADWENVIDELVKRIVRDRTLPIGSNYVQDLLLQLYLMGLYRESAFLPQKHVLIMNKIHGPFCSWKTAPPPTVYLAFTVPRAKFAIIEGSGAPPFPVLAVQITSSPLCNNFQSIETVFGNLSVRGKAQNRTATIHEPGQNNGSPVVVILPVPTWLLTYDPRNTTISLIIVSTPMTALLVPYLGLNLSLFDVHLMKARSVHILKWRPTIVSQSSLSTTMTPLPATALSGTTSDPATLACLDRKRQSIVALKQRIKILLEEANARLTLGKRPQSSLCEIEFSTGHPRRPLVVRLPFPVDASKLSTTVHRATSCINVS